MVPRKGVRLRIVPTHKVGICLARLQFYCHTHGEVGNVHKVTTGALDKLPKRTNLKEFVAFNRKRFYSAPPPKTYQDDSHIDI